MKVDWPGGVTDTICDVKVDRDIVVGEGSGLVDSSHS